MTYRIDLLPAAQRELDKLPDAVFAELDPMIRALAQVPRPEGAKSVSGRRGHYRIRWGDYRAAYEVNDRARVVTIKAVGHRRDIYRVLRRR